MEKAPVFLKTRKIPCAKLSKSEYTWQKKLYEINTSHAYILYSGNWQPPRKDVSLSILIDRKCIFALIRTKITMRPNKKSGTKKTFALFNGSSDKIFDWQDPISACDDKTRTYVSTTKPICDFRLIYQFVYIVCSLIFFSLPFSWVRLFKCVLDLPQLTFLCHRMRREKRKSERLPFPSPSPYMKLDFSMFIFIFINDSNAYLDKTSKIDIKRNWIYAVSI